MNPDLLDAVVEVSVVAEEMHIRVVLVGALMMEFTTEIGKGYPEPERTNDADFAVWVDDWESFKGLRARLESRGFTRVAHIEHRLAKKGRGVLIDLIPIGEGVGVEGRIVWPESGQEMSIIGFREVCRAVAAEVRAGLPKVPVITVPGFVLLKILAFRDRYQRRDLKYRNDVEHVAYWLEHYASLSEMDSRRVDFLKIKGWRDLEVDLAGAALLGEEVSRLCSREAAEQVTLFLRESNDEESPLVDTIILLRRPLGSVEETDSLRGDVSDRLKAFGRGFESAAHKTRK